MESRMNGDAVKVGLRTISAVDQQVLLRRRPEADGGKPELNGSFRSESPLKSEGSIRDRAKIRDIASLWAKRVLYQLVFAAFLTLFTAWLLFFEMSTLDSFHPRISNAKRVNVGLGFRPLPQDPYSTLIRFRHGVGGDWKPLVVSIIFDVFAALKPRVNLERFEERWSGGEWL